MVLESIEERKKERRREREREKEGRNKGRKKQRKEEREGSYFNYILGNSDSGTENVPKLEHYTSFIILEHKNLTHKNKCYCF